MAIIYLLCLILVIVSVLMLLLGEFVFVFKMWVYTDKGDYEAADHARTLLTVWTIGWCAVGLLCAMVFLHGC